MLPTYDRCPMPSLASPPEPTARLYKEVPRRAPKCAGGRSTSARGRRRPEAHAAADLRRSLQAIMRSLDRPQALEDLGRHGRAAARLLAHVKRHELVGGGEIALRRVIHLVDIVDALRVVGEEEGGEAEGIALAHLAMVGHVGFEGEGGDARGPAMALVESDPAEELVRGEIEDDQGVPHVHLAGGIYPFGTYAVAIGVERRRDIGGHGRLHHTVRGCQPRRPQTREPRASTDRSPATQPVAARPPHSQT